MIAMFGVRKVWIAAPVLAALAALTALALPASDVEADALATLDAVEEVVIDDDVALVASNCTYYSNASHTTIVGQFGYDCCNNRVAWGRKTSFYECGGCFICFPPPQ